VKLICGGSWASRTLMITLISPAMPAQQSR
jgi:hypothetical protein